MKNQPIQQAQGEHGFLNIGILVIIAAAIVVGGWFLLKSEVAIAPTSSPSANEFSSPTGSPTPDGVVCTQDVKLCSDGSYVGRTGPKCEFKCPAVKWNSYTSSDFGFSLQYPTGWQVNSKNRGSFVFYKVVGDHKNEIYLVMENNPNRISTSAWLAEVGINTAGAKTSQVNGLTAIQVTEGTSPSTTHVYMATGDRVAHFFVENETDFMTIFNHIVASFKITN